MNATRIETHVDDALGRLLQQYKGRQNFAALLRAMVAQVQELEDALFAIANCTGLQSGASGAQLDVVGAIVGAQRQGLNDEQYLALLQGTISQNQGDATPETILTILRKLFGTQAVFLKRPGMAHATPQAAAATVSVAIGSPAVSQSVLAQVIAALKAALGAGTALNYLAKFDAQGAFAFAGSQPWVRGFGSIHDASAGGKFASLLSSATAS